MITKGLIGGLALGDLLGDSMDFLFMILSRVNFDIGHC